MNPETKHLDATLKSTSDEGPGTWTAVVSSPSLDRDGEHVDAGAFNPLPKKLPVHDRHFGSLIGSCVPYYSGNELHVDGRFASAPLAQNIRTLVLEGHLQAMSVGFLPITDKKVKGVRHVTKAELVTCDWAPMPSNRDARLLAVRSSVKDHDIESKLAAKAAWMTLQAQLAGLAVDLQELEAKQAQADAAHERFRYKRMVRIRDECLAEHEAKQARKRALDASIEHGMLNPPLCTGPGYTRNWNGERIDLKQTWIPGRDPQSTAPLDAPPLRHAVDYGTPPAPETTFNVGGRNLAQYLAQNGLQGPPGEAAEVETAPALLERLQAYAEVTIDEDIILQEPAANTDPAEAAGAEEAPTATPPADVIAADKAED